MQLGLSDRLSPCPDFIRRAETPLHQGLESRDVAWRLNPSAPLSFRVALDIISSERYMLE